jgi:flavin-dependent dehydrogenase
MQAVLLPLTGEGIYGAVIRGQTAASVICANFDRSADANKTFIHLTKKNMTGIWEPLRMRRHHYAYPDRGFQAMKIPLLRNAILKTTP